MLRAYALADLFGENVDSTVEGIFLTTTGGNLIGQSSHLPPALSKRLSVLGALTWRTHAMSMPGFNSINAQSVGTSAASSYGGITMQSPPSGESHSIAPPAADPSHERAYPLTVLKKVAGNPGELRELAFECDGRVCALEYVREGLLIAALSGVVTQDKARGAALNGEAVDERGSSGEDGENGNGTVSASYSRRGSGETDEPAATAASERERAKRNDRLVRLLSLKANAMADYLRDEIKNFRMPSGLE